MTERPAPTDDALWTYRARLVDVIDADTIRCLIDTGFGGRHEADIRVADVDAPEASTPEGRLARSLAAQLLWQVIDEDGWPVRVRTRRLLTVTKEARSFARWVADVWWRDEGEENTVAWRHLGTELVREGIAVAVDGGQR